MQYAKATLLMSVAQSHGYLSLFIYKWCLWSTLYHANRPYYLKLKKHPLRKLCPVLQYLAVFILTESLVKAKVL